MTGQALVLRGDARALPLPDASVDLVVTSPPYWRLRSYTDGGEHYDGQIGDEADPREYVANLVACTREWMRVLKPTGSIWVNIGDRFSDRANAGPSRSRSGRADHAEVIQARTSTTSLAPRKSLLGLPWRYALACIDELGLILRRDQIWEKANGLPESVDDRCRGTHEYLFHFAMRERYFAAIDEIRTPHSESTVKRAQPHRAPVTGTRSAYQAGMPAQTVRRDRSMHLLGALPGSVWTIPTEPLLVPGHIAHARCCAGARRPGCENGLDHYAAFPTELPRQVILGWSPSGICTACGEGRRPVVDRPGKLGGDNNPDSRNGTRRRSTMDGGSAEWKARVAVPDRLVGYACACTPYTDHPGTGARHSNGTGPHGNHRAFVGDGPASRPSDLNLAPRVGPWREYHLDSWSPAPTTPSVVVDPFGGTGTTALVAAAHGRVGITVDRSGDYCRLATWRTTDRGQIAKVLGVPRPAEQFDGQLDLFTADGTA